MKALEMRKKSRVELATFLSEKLRRCEELVTLLRQKKVKNVKELSAVKRDIARIKTILRESRS